MAKGATIDEIYIETDDGVIRKISRSNVNTEIVKDELIAEPTDEEYVEEREL